MTLIPTQVTFHGLAHSDALEADIHERVTWLEQFYSGIVRCRVRVEMPHRHRRDSRDFQVHIELAVSGGAPIVVSHQPAQGDAHIATHQAFDAVRRRLEDFAREQRGAVKTHDSSAVRRTAFVSQEG